MLAIYLLLYQIVHQIPVRTDHVDQRRYAFIVVDVAGGASVLEVALALLDRDQRDPDADGAVLKPVAEFVVFGGFEVSIESLFVARPVDLEELEMKFL